MAGHCEDSSEGPMGREDDEAAERNIGRKQNEHEGKGPQPRRRGSGAAEELRALIREPLRSRSRSLSRSRAGSRRARTAAAILESSPYTRGRLNRLIDRLESSNRLATGVGQRGRRADRAAGRAKTSDGRLRPHGRPTSPPAIIKTHTLLRVCPTLLKKHRPYIFAEHKKLVRVYQVNHRFKSLTAKLLANIYLFTVAFLMIRTCDPWYSYFKYLTCVAWTLVQIYFVVTLVLDLRSRLTGHKIGLLTSTLCQSLSELALAVSVVVTTLFWGFIYPRQSDRSVIWEIQMHGLGLLLMLFDYLYRFAGFQLRNLRIMYAFSIFYAVLHILVVVHSGEPIYPGLDFRNVQSFVLFCVALTILVYSHKVLYLISNWAHISSEWKIVLGVSPELQLLEDLGVDVSRLKSRLWAAECMEEPLW